VVQAWALVFGLLAAVFVAVGLHHAFALPRPAADQPTAGGGGLVKEFLGVFAAFLRKPGIPTILAFLLLYRLGEAQALKLLSPFLLDARDKGGLGLSTREVGIVYGTVGIIALTVGGLLGGWAISRRGLKAMLWPMILATHVPVAVFLLLAFYQPTSLWLIGGALAVEQFGYGFGFTAYMLYMMLVADGPHKTAHYAICTGFMALGMMLPGMAAGWIEDQIGYVKFFAWVLACTVPSFVVIARLKIDPEFGRKAKT
jgi:PAT family beta-lactamase induction signal transducer AmpG